MPHSEDNPRADEGLFQAEHQKLLRLALSSLSEGVTIVNAAGALVYSSPYASQLFGAGGLPTPPVQGNPLGLFGSDEQTPLPLEQLPLWRALKGEEAREVEVFIRNERVPRGRHLRCQGIPLRDEQGQIIGGMLLVKSLEESEHRIAERTAQLEFANRELEAFAYSVAHDLRAPLRAIASFSEALTEDCADRLDATGLDYLRRILGGVQRMSELIEGILSLSRVHRTALESRRCDLSALARAIFEQLQSQSPERTVRFTVQEELVDRGDPQLLRSVLENLLGNAWKFTRERPVAEIEFGATQAQGGRTYFVKDNGAGFDMAYQHKLFGLFQRLHSQAEFEGNGIGLATAQRIIRRHGGRIWARGQPGEGACFFFTLNEPSLATVSPTPPETPRD